MAFLYQTCSLPQWPEAEVCEEQPARLHQNRDKRKQLLKSRLFEAVLPQSREWPLGRLVRKPKEFKVKGLRQS